MDRIEWSSEAMGHGEYAEVNGINLYYETHGSGRPMVLLHGGLGSGAMFGPVLPALAAARGGPARAAGRGGGAGGARGAARASAPPIRRPADGRRHRGPDRPPRA